MRHSAAVTLSLVLAAGLWFGGCGAPRPSRPPEAPGKPVLDVVYPRLSGGDTVLAMPRVDSVFAFGSVRPPDSWVYLNGVPARVWDNGAFLAWAQSDLKKLVAYSSISHLGFVVLGLFALNGRGVAGGVLQMV
ncbi:MAG: hypothetical protein C4524_09685, partial [Candidatus Zixiibacteriota bacterium]